MVRIIPRGHKKGQGMYRIALFFLFGIIKKSGASEIIKRQNPFESLELSFFVKPQAFTCGFFMCFRLCFNTVSYIM